MNLEKLFKIHKIRILVLGMSERARISRSPQCRAYNGTKRTESKAEVSGKEEDKTRPWNGMLSEVGRRPTGKSGDKLVWCPYSSFINQGTFSINETRPPGSRRSSKKKNKTKLQKHGHY